VGDAGGQVAVGYGSVWVSNTGRDSVSRIDPATNKVVATIRVGSAPFGVAVGVGAVWVTNQDGNTVSRIDPSRNRVAATIRVGMLPIGVAITPGAVWVGNHHGDSVVVIDPTTNEVVKTVSVGSTPVGGPAHMVAGAGAVWIGVPDTSSITRIDTATSTVRANAKIASGGVCGDVALASNAVWIAGGGCAVGITRVNPTTGKTVTTIGHDEVAGVALGRRTLWYTTLQGTVIGRINPRTNAMLSPVKVPGTPTGLAIGYGSLWVADPALRAVLRLTPNP